MTEEEFKEKHKHNPILSMLEELQESDLLRVLNVDYFADRFFGESKDWFSERLNNHLNNNETSAFTSEEIEKLRNALYALSIELQGIADELH